MEFLTWCDQADLPDPRAVVEDPEHRGLGRTVRTGCGRCCRGVVGWAANAGHRRCVAQGVGAAAGCCRGGRTGRGGCRCSTAGAVPAGDCSRPGRCARPVRPGARRCRSGRGRAQHERPGEAARPAEHEAFRLGRLVAAERAPYFMHALFAVAPVACAGAGHVRRGRCVAALPGPRAARRGRAVGQLPPSAAVLLHEVGSSAARPRRPRRRPAAALATTWRGTSPLTPRSTTTCSPAGVPLPAGVRHPRALGCDDGDLAEVYYATWCHRRHPPRPCRTTVLAGCGSGAGCGPVAGGAARWGGVWGTAARSRSSAAEADLVRRRVARRRAGCRARQGAGQRCRLG